MAEAFTKFRAELGIAALVVQVLEAGYADHIAKGIKVDGEIASNSDTSLVSLSFGLWKTDKQTCTRVVIDCTPTEFTLRIETGTTTWPIETVLASDIIDALDGWVHS